MRLVGSCKYTAVSGYWRYLKSCAEFFYCTADKERIGGKSLFPLHPFAAFGASHSQCCYGYSSIFCRDRDYQSLAAIHRSADGAMAGRAKCLLCITGLVYMEKLRI